MKSCKKIKESLQNVIKELNSILNDTQEEINLVNVIVFCRGNIKENIVTFTADDAEEIFLQKCSEYLSNWDEYTVDDIQEILDNGYERNGAGIEIIINWPEVRRK